MEGLEEMTGGGRKIGKRRRCGIEKGCSSVFLRISLPDSFRYLTLDSPSSCLSILSAGVVDIHHQGCGNSDDTGLFGRTMLWKVHT